jgi:hypothetical protein
MIPASSIQAFRSEIEKIAEDRGQPISDREVKSIQREVDLWNRLRKISPVKVKEDRLADLHGGAYFDQQAQEIGLSKKDYESLAHEMGHAELDKKILGRLIQSPTARGVFGLTPLAGAVAGALVAKGKKLGLLLPVATAAPTISSEMWATHKGKGKLREAGATDEEIDRYKKNLRQSFLSYAGLPLEAAAAGGLTYTIGK